MTSKKKPAKKQPKAASVVLGVRLDAAEVERLAGQAGLVGLTTSDVLRRIVRDALADGWTVLTSLERTAARQAAAAR